MVFVSLISFLDIFLGVFCFFYFFLGTVRLNGSHANGFSLCLCHVLLI